MSGTCPYIPELPYSGFRDRLRKKLGTERIPLSGSLELAFRCNLRCQHCYISHGHTGIPGKQELTYPEIQRILDEIVDAGCLWLLLTGGEAMMRRDFTEIYLYAKRKGLLLTLFTNATMLTPRMVGMLAEYRPFNLEITLYGWTQETYERVTGIPGSHKRCYQGIELLQKYGIPFRLKTVLMTHNWHELKEMRTYADSLGVAFRYDPLINGGIDGCGKPMDVRLPAHKVVEIEMEDADLTQDWQDFIASHDGWKNDNHLLYQCGAGLTSFHIDPYGELSLCMMARHHTYDLRRGSFKTGWDDFLHHERFQMAPADHACNQCKLQAMCVSCPGWSYTEHGNSTAHVDYICEVTHLRAEQFGKPAESFPSGLIQIELPVEDPLFQPLTQVHPLETITR